GLPRRSLTRFMRFTPPHTVTTASAAWAKPRIRDHNRPTTSQSYDGTAGVWLIRLPLPSIQLRNPDTSLRVWCPSPTSAALNTAVARRPGRSADPSGRCCRRLVAEPKAAPAPRRDMRRAAAGRQPACPRRGPSRPILQSEQRQPVLNTTVRGPSRHQNPRSREVPLRGVALHGRKRHLQPLLRAVCASLELERQTAIGCQPAEANHLAI